MGSPFQAIFSAVALAASAIVSLSLFSCARQPATAEHTVAEYRANADLRRAQFARCANDPGTLGATPDCINAREASRLEDMGSVRNVAPVRLPRPSVKK
jgi:hypothetical protein